MIWTGRFIKMAVQKTFFNKFGLADSSKRQSNIGFIISLDWQVRQNGSPNEVL